MSEDNKPCISGFSAFRAAPQGLWYNFTHLMRMTLGALRHRSQWREVADKELRRYSLEETKALSDVQIYSLQEKVGCLSPAAFQVWNKTQLQGLSARQYRCINIHQIQAFILNPSATSIEIDAFIRAIAREGHYHKIGEVLQVLQAAPFERTACVIETILSLSDTKTRAFLAIIAQVATPKQFEAVLARCPFTQLKTLFEGDRLQVFDPEYQQLSLEIEQSEFENNMRIQELEEQINRFEEVWHSSSIEQIHDIIGLVDEEQLQHPDVVANLVEIIGNGRKVFRCLLDNVELPDNLGEMINRTLRKTQPEKSYVATRETLRAFCRQAETIRNDLAYHHTCLREKNQSAANFISHWKEEYLPSTYWEVMEEGGPPEVVDVGFARIRKDNDFLTEVMPSFYQKVRHEAFCGNFSVKFLLRLLVQKISTEQMEELLLMPGMLQLLDLTEVTIEAENILAELAKAVAENIRAA